MRRRSFHGDAMGLCLVAVALGVGCGGGGTPPTPARGPSSPAPSNGPAPSTSTVTEDGAHRETDYRVGDRVAYRYSGTYTDAPVLITERIVNVEGNELEIHVAAERGDERREWIQVVTDTEANRTSDTVDALYVIEDGERRELPNQDNADLMRLYEWIVPPCEGEPTSPPTSSERTLQVGDASHECTCVSLGTTCNGEPAELTSCECAEFLWTQATTRIEPAAGGPTIYQSEVVEHGRAEEADVPRARPAP